MNQALRLSSLSIVSFLSIWLGISALLVSTSLAQVNGSGPSPSSLFDTVINLPDDVALIVGSVGGVAGQTTQLNVTSGGTVAAFFFADSGSEVNISGGIVGGDFEANSGSEINISGGEVGNSFDAQSGSMVNISGGDVGNLFDALSGSEVNISGGAVGVGFEAFGDSEVNISGGVVGGGFDAFGGSEVNISGGEVGAGFDALSGSEVNISGGVVLDGFDAFDGSVVNISGGVVGNLAGPALQIPAFNAFGGSEVNILGSEFQIDGSQLDTLLLGEAFTITDRDVVLSGLLADGEQFSFVLLSTDLPGFDFFSPGATLTVTLTSPVLLGDVNLDGVVDFFDIAPFITLLSNGGTQAEADINQSGEINFLDVAPFIGLLTGQ